MIQFHAAVILFAAPFPSPPGGADDTARRHNIREPDMRASCLAGMGR